MLAQTPTASATASPMIRSTLSSVVVATAHLGYAQARCKCGRHEYIKDLECRAYQTKFSVRYGTAAYRLKTASHRVGEVLTVLVEALSVGAAVRVFGHGESSERGSRAPACTPPRCMSDFSTTEG